VVAASEQPQQDCKDLHDNVQCREWAWFGECDKNKEFMHDQCKQSCGLCKSIDDVDDVDDDDDIFCKDAFHSCNEWAEHGKCEGLWTSKKGSFTINGAYLIEFCPRACNVCDIHLDERDMSLNLGLPQAAPGMDTDKHLYNHLRAKVAEVRKYVASFEDNKVLQNACKMSNPYCARFALATDCEDHKDHDLIKYGCPAACKTCENLEREEGGIAKAEAYWLQALKEYETSHQTTYTLST